ncbi:hypothetical protein LTR78_001020 [Recurvomyces mirabilis]|uniref:THO complex subunit 1 n=1 Tax=Recurvomyces mirabilis TaxID=574656 RepID=A0AAE0WWY2_9PEZI|nr:hypothetical protein LTR78_001020 [Recurvomyces mirabilis]KAK5158992.1 hypothetical protein LTS14_003100 [Recurvomyces mirabilis]
MAADSAAGLPLVAQTITRLEALLQRARTLKREAAIEPPLSTADLVLDVDALGHTIDERYEQSYRFSVVEAAARRIFYSLIYETVTEDPNFVQVWNLLDILLVCSDKGLCTPELVPWLIEELLDSQTTTGCRTVFDYLGSRRERLAAKDFNKKHLVCLRFCNELLRRLSRAEDAMFCGRVFFFLFQTFPLGDKSSVNLRGEFHIENTTKFEEADGEAMDVDDRALEGDKAMASIKAETPQPPTKPGGKATPARVAPKKVPEEIVLSNNKLYPIFWRLQADFSDPIRLFTKENFETFKSSLGHTLIKFKKTPTVVQTKAAGDDTSNRGLKRKHGDEEGADTAGNNDLAANYNPKYLTSRDLFDLELSDLAFQRHILLQSLILISFLLSLTAPAKTRLASTLETTNKSMIYPLTLSPEDTKWCQDTRNAITDFLRQVPTLEEGRFYHRMVETVLARDRNWVRWKGEGCPSIVRESVGIESVQEAGKGARDATRLRRVPERAGGALDLGFLVEGGGLDALRNPARFAAPSVEELVEGVKGEELDLEMAMDEAEQEGLKNAIGSKTWRALRQVRETQLGMLRRVEVNGDLEVVLGKMARPDEGVMNDVHEEGEEAAALDIGDVVADGPDHTGEELKMEDVDEQVDPASKAMPLPATDMQTEAAKVINMVDADEKSGVAADAEDGIA